MRDEHTMLRDREGEGILVLDGPVGVTGLKERGASTTCNSTFSFVAKARDATLCGCVFVNLGIDVARMGAPVSPGVPEIVGPKRRITGKERLVGGPEPASLLQDPHRDPRSNDAGLAAADLRHRLQQGFEFAQSSHGLIISTPRFWGSSAQSRTPRRSPTTARRACGPSPRTAVCIHCIYNKERVPLGPAQPHEVRAHGLDAAVVLTGRTGRIRVIEQ